MPLSSRDQERVKKIQQASAHLRSTGAPELAEHVDFLLTDEGANFVNRLRWKEAADENPNLALSMPMTVRNKIKRRVAAANAQIPAQAVLALNAFLNGEFTPARPQELFPRGAGGPRANLNVRVNAELRREVDEHGKRLKADGVLDWEPSTSAVLKAWFVARFTAGSDSSKK